MTQCSHSQGTSGIMMPKLQLTAFLFRVDSVVVMYNDGASMQRISVQTFRSLGEFVTSCIKTARQNGHELDFSQGIVLYLVTYWGCQDRAPVKSMVINAQQITEIASVGSKLSFPPLFHVEPLHVCCVLPLVVFVRLASTSLLFRP